MKVLETCVGCGSCVNYCPVNAIAIVDGQACIDQDECVECGVCLRAKVCPVDALYQPELEWPRVLRSQFSDPVAEHPRTGVRGRGTAEMKTNDVTGRFKVGYAGIALEIGRPGIGTKLREVERIYKELLKLGVVFESDNPVAGIVDEENPGQFKQDVLDEKVLSAIHEFLVPTERVKEVLPKLKEICAVSDTVISMCIIDRLTPDGKMPNYQLAKEAGFNPSINAKVNAGLGRPLAE
ncbi:MAG: indolepyruvate ferredoxin oxidoreductase subunit alpha [bacterium]|jgi:NAD-dependent dihydropyrimidine dehydrogenase PreA subunit